MGEYFERGIAHLKQLGGVLERVREVRARALARPGGHAAAFLLIKLEALADRELRAAADLLLDLAVRHLSAAARRVQRVGASGLCGPAGLAPREQKIQGSVMN